MISHRKLKIHAFEGVTLSTVGWSELLEVNHNVFRNLVKNYGIERAVRQSKGLPLVVSNCAPPEFSALHFDVDQELKVRIEHYRAQGVPDSQILSRARAAL